MFFLLLQRHGHGMMVRVRVQGNFECDIHNERRYGTSESDSRASDWTLTLIGVA